jgi:hypothetical protein
MKHLLNYKPFLMIKEAQESDQSETPAQDQPKVEIPERKKVTKSPNYKKPEFEFKEFYRAFKNNESLQTTLPKEIDKKIFKVKGTGFKGEPKWIGLHLDPPSKQKNEDGEEVQLIGTEDFIKVAKEKDERFVPFIEYCKELFDNGKMEQLQIDFIIKNMDNFKSHDWHEIKNNPDYLDQCVEEYQKALEAGLDDVSLNQKGLVQKYPDIKINFAQAWSGYFKDSINYFNSVAKGGGALPCTQFIVHDGIYYTIGGRRRMFWHFYNKLNPKVWLIKI